MSFITLANPECLLVLRAPCSHFPSALVCRLLASPVQSCSCQLHLDRLLLFTVSPARDETNRGQQVITELSNLHIISGLAADQRVILKTIPSVAALMARLILLAL